MLSLFDLNGYNSGCSHLSKRYTIHIFIVHFVMVTLLTMSIFHLKTKYFVKLKTSEAISEVLQFTFALCSYWLIILDSICHRQIHQQFWDTFQQIDQYFCAQTNLDLRNYLIKCMIFLIKTIVTIGIRLMGHSFAGFDLDAPYVIIFIICDIRMFYYLFCLEVLHFQFKIIETETETIKATFHSGMNRDSISHRSKKGRKNAKLQRMKWIREYFHCSYEMVCNLNKIFGWSNVAEISFCFCFLLTEIYWFYNHQGTTFLFKFSKCFNSLIVSPTNFTDFQPFSNGNLCVTMSSNCIVLVSSCSL